jgi:glycosyltransferase involved in cell wall biosynthesis
LGGEGHLDARLIVTGPPGPHNPANAAYLQSLLDLRRKLGIEDVAHFLYELGITPDDDTMADLYRLADALLFPSTQEGFGIPVLEAGLARMPVFCSDIPPLRETGGSEVYAFPLDADPADVAALIQRTLDADPAYLLRRRVLEGYSWEVIVRRKIIPLLEGR